MYKSKKGTLTELGIIKSTKGLFHEKGYAKTSMRDISSHANVKLGTLTYYFNKKEELCLRIYADTVIRLYSFIRSNKQEKLNSIQLNFHMTCLYQKCYSIDRATSDFHLEIISHENIYRSIYSQLFARLYATIYRELAKNIPERDLETAIFSDLCVKRELSSRFLKKDYPKDFRELFRDSATMMGRIFRLNEETTQQYINEAIQFCDLHDSSSIALLV